MRALHPSVPVPVVDQSVNEGPDACSSASRRRVGLAPSEMAEGLLPSYFTGCVRHMKDA